MAQYGRTFGRAGRRFDGAGDKIPAATRRLRWSRAISSRTLRGTCDHSSSERRFGPVAGSRGGDRRILGLAFATFPRRERLLMSASYEDQGPL